MTVSLLILDRDAGYMKGCLKDKYPELTIHAVSKEEDAERFIKEV